jgi:hypothetical protein
MSRILRHNKPGLARFGAVLDCAIQSCGEKPISAIAPWLECTKVPDSKATYTCAMKIIYRLGVFIYKRFLSQNCQETSCHPELAISPKYSRRSPCSFDPKFDGQPGTPVPDRLGIVFLAAVFEAPALGSASYSASLEPEPRSEPTHRVGATRDIRKIMFLLQYGLCDLEISP